MPDTLPPAPISDTEPDPESKAETGVGERIVPGHTQDRVVQKHRARYAWVLERVPEGAHVLDAGCGSGYGSQVLASSAGRVRALDYSPTAVTYASREHPEERVDHLAANVTSLPFPDSAFDFVTCFEVIEHVPDPAAALMELSRVMRPGATLVMSTPVGRPGVRTPANPHHLREYRPEQYRELLEEAFTVCEHLAQKSRLSSAAKGLRYVLRKLAGLLKCEGLTRRLEGMERAQTFVPVTGDEKRGEQIAVCEPRKA